MTATADEDTPADTGNHEGAFAVPAIHECVGGQAEDEVRDAAQRGGEPSLRRRASEGKEQQGKARLLTSVPTAETVWPLHKRR